MIEVREVTPEDRDAWLVMRVALWPDGSRDEHRDEIERYFAGTLVRRPYVVWIGWSGQQPIGFVEASIRDYAEGCTSDRVAYLEGWYVHDQYRRHGVGRALVHRCESWATTEGCTEMCSDVELQNGISERAHVALDFQEVARAIHFRKRL